MIRKFALGLVAVAALGAAALAPTAASAFPLKGKGWHPHPHPHWHHHHPVYMAPSLYIGAPMMSPGCFEKRLVQTKKGLRWRTVNVCAY
ncbi:hypothetical protein [Bradyrhizobium sp. LHD-71]|uniref:hypothetical protein n=1 Tax=Bradyrhizobium sp. LHD-71 TaxID=3072141 RepID=UPI00280E9343|nr:hypothetical protein [Bradyrhizobium sp. LHD-71]MDQ8729895.1 hypothetical protein [Bradyrhizobium sp. LHD-71]